MNAHSAKVISCRRCAIDFERRHSAQRFCSACQGEGAKETRQRAERAWRERNKRDPGYRAKRTERTRDYVRRNRDKAAAYQQEYAALYSEKKRLSAKKWRDENPELSRALTLKNYYDNRQAILARNKTPEAKARRQARENHLWRTCPIYRLDICMGSSIRTALGHRKGGRKWEHLVGYTLADLMAHLERQFLKGMTWDNRRQWHIDHIVPKSSFKYQSPDDPEFKAAWALTNLRPIWAAENIKKRDKRLFLI